MAVEVYSNNTSPRISFSHDLQDAETIPIIETYPPSFRLDPCLLEENTSATTTTTTTSSIEFAFSIDERIRPEASSTADELFSDGKILPIDIKRDRFDETADQTEVHETTTTRADNAADAVIQNVGAASSDGNKKELKSLREFLADSIDDEDGANPDTTTTTTTSTAAAASTAPRSPSGSHQKSFWKFRRSNSLNNCEYRNDHPRNGRRLIKQPLKMLPRSKSAGEYISKQISIIQEERESDSSSFWKFSRSNSSRVDINSDNTNNNSKGLIRSIKVLLRSESSTGTSCSDNHSKRSTIAEDEKPSMMPRNSNNRYMRRSSSLNSDHKYHVQVTIGSMTFLSRSNSTGSSAPPKQYYLKQHSMRRQKSVSRTAAGKSYMSPSSDSSTNNCDKKATPVKKNCKNSGSGVRAITPVLNLIPAPYISKATVGFSSLFCNGSSKDKKKKP